MIDMKRVLEFCDDDKALAETYIAMFKTETQEALRQMPQLLANDQRDELSILAHKVKSHFNLTGVFHLADLFANIENEAVSASIEELESMIQQAIEEATPILESI